MLQKICLALFPPECLLCSHRSQRIEPFCKQCESLLPWLSQGCQTCAAPLLTNDSRHCGQCISHPPDTDNTVCIFAYEQPIKHWITQYKFNHQLHLIRLFSHWISNQCQARSRHIDLIIPVPIHTRKLKQRGFNQCDLIGKDIAQSFQLPYSNKLLIKKKNTKPQITLSSKARLKNLQNSFVVKGDIRNCRIAVIEDIITTGATVREVAKTLKKAGASRVEVWAIARTHV